MNLIEELFRKQKNVTEGVNGDYKYYIEGPELLSWAIEDYNNDRVIHNYKEFLKVADDMGFQVMMSDFDKYQGFVNGFKEMEGTPVSDVEFDDIASIEEGLDESVKNFIFRTKSGDDYTIPAGDSKAALDSFKRRFPAEEIEKFYDEDGEYYCPISGEMMDESTELNEDLVGVRKRQLNNNIEELVDEYLNGIYDGVHEEFKNNDELVDYVYSQIFDMKSNGGGHTRYGRGIADDLKYLGKDYIVKEIIRIGNEEGVVATEEVEEGITESKNEIDEPLRCAQMSFETGHYFHREDFDSDEEFQKYSYYMEFGPSGFYEEFKDTLDFDPDFAVEYGHEDEDDEFEEESVKVTEGRKFKVGDTVSYIDDNPKTKGVIAYIHNDGTCDVVVNGDPDDLVNVDMDFLELWESAKVNEDTVKKSNGKWVNRGDDGKEHGEFDTKKEADAQRKAMFANGYKGESIIKEQVDIGKTYIYSTIIINPVDEGEAELSKRDGMKCTVIERVDSDVWGVKFEDGYVTTVFADELAPVGFESVKKKVTNESIKSSDSKEVLDLLYQALNKLSDMSDDKWSTTPDKDWSALNKVMDDISKAVARFNKIETESVKKESLKESYSDSIGSGDLRDIADKIYNLADEMDAKGKTIQLDANTYGMSAPYLATYEGFLELNAIDRYLGKKTDKYDDEYFEVGDIVYAVDDDPQVPGTIVAIDEDSGFADVQVNGTDDIVRMDFSEIAHW